MGSKYPIAQHGFSAPEFRKSGIPDTRHASKRDKDAWAKFNEENPKQEHGPLKIKIKRKDGTVKKFDQTVNLHTYKNYGPVYGNQPKDDSISQKDYNREHYTPEN